MGCGRSREGHDVRDRVGKERALEKFGGRSGKGTHAWGSGRAWLLGLLRRRRLRAAFGIGPKAVFLLGVCKAIGKKELKTGMAGMASSCIDEPCSMSLSVSFPSRRCWRRYGEAGSAVL